MLQFFLSPGSSPPPVEPDANAQPEIVQPSLPPGFFSFTLSILEQYPTTDAPPPGQSGIVHDIHPPIIGSPWFVLTLVEEYPTVNAGQAPDVSVQGETATPLRLPGSPWFSLAVTESFPTTNASPPGQGPTMQEFVLPFLGAPRGGVELPAESVISIQAFVAPVVVPPGRNKLFIDRMRGTDTPDDKRRLQRLTEIVSILVNSLASQGILIQTAPASFIIAGAGSFAFPRPPLPSDDISAGITPGASWVDTNASKVYLNISNKAGAAVWQSTASSAGTGLTGTFP